MNKLEDVRLVWHTHYYDGPLAGIARYQERLYYFEAFEDDIMTDGPWRYRLRELTDEQEVTFIIAKLDFEMHVGLHCSYDIEGHRLPDPPLGVDVRRNYAEVPLPDVLANRIVGYFVR